MLWPMRTGRPLAQGFRGACPASCSGRRPAVGSIEGSIRGGRHLITAGLATECRSEGGAIPHRWVRFRPTRASTGFVISVGGSPSGVGTRSSWQDHHPSLLVMGVDFQRSRSFSAQRTRRYEGGAGSTAIRTGFGVPTAPVSTRTIDTMTSGSAWRGPSVRRTHPEPTASDVSVCWPSAARSRREVWT
jgi:hypothetical protein